MRALWFGLAWLMPLSAALGLQLGGAWLLAAPVFLFLVLPALDEALSLDTGNPEHEGNPLFDLWLLLWVPTQLALVAWSLHEISTGGRALVERLGIAANVGVVSGAVGITVAHELMHRSTRLHRALGELLMTVVTYPHFCIEHVLGHHRNVATPGDPATSRLGESVFAFLPRTIGGSLVSAWRLEGARVARTGDRLGDRRLRMPVLVVLLYAGAWAAFGRDGALALGVESAVAILLLEVINYIEHYGLERARLADGGFERVLPAHSWNAAQRLSGHMLFELSRHADHHANASRPYWALRHLEDAPQLPAGYGTMLLLALVPPLWRRVMDPRALAWRARVDSSARRTACGREP